MSWHAAARFLFILSYTGIRDNFSDTGKKIHATLSDVQEKVIHTVPSMYSIRNGEALRLSTGISKKPWISFVWRSIVIMCVKPEIINYQGLHL